MKKLFAIAVASALALPTAASASTFACDGCTPAQMYDVAWSELYSPGVQPGYIVNLANGTVAKYANIANIPDPFDPEPPPYEPNIIAVPVEAPIASLIYDLYVMTNGNTRVIDVAAAQASMAPGVRLPVNAYEYVGSPHLQEQVTELVRRDAQDIAFRIAQAAAVSTSYVYFHGVPVYVTLKSADGSQVKYRYDEVLQKWFYIPGSARDARNNPVPDKKEDVLFNGDFIDVSGGDTGPGDDTNWARWLLESFGIPVIDMRLGGSGGIVCLEGACYLQSR